MRFLRVRSLMSFSDKEVNARLYYFYKILDSLQDSNFDGSILKVFRVFVKRLGKEDRAGKIFQLHIDRLILDGRLHLVPDAESEHAWKFSCRKKIPFSLLEDEQAQDKFFSFKTETELDANILRVAFIGGKQKIVRVFEQIFFSETDSMNFRRIAVPKNILKDEKELSLTKFLVDNGSLSKSQAYCLQILFRYSTTQEFSEHLDSLYLDGVDLIRLLKIDHKTFDSVNENLSTGLLHSFLDYDWDVNREFINTIEAQDLQPFFNDMSRKMSLRGAYPLETFSVKKEVSDIATSLLRGSDSTNILLYGAAGSGKTEYAKSLVKAAGLKAVLFKNSYETEESIEAAISALNVLLSINKSDTVFIVDEAESVLETKPIEGLFGTVSRKATVNKLFENCANKVIWIVNYTERMDDSTKRRFTYSIQFNKMGEERFREISRAKLRKFSYSADFKKKVLELCGKYEVTGSSVNNMMSVMRAFDGTDEKSLENTVRNVLESNSSLLYGQAKMREKAKSQYDITVLNSSVPAEQIVEMVENAKKYAETNDCPEEGIRMLFYGLSGTGKTELARHIAQKLGKHILLKRASDIITSLVGDTEKNISAAFKEAEQTGQILLFDEADSFFADRNTAQHSWERTQVNEFLTQMEEFKGILICTTNLRNIMDRAMLRRFHICAEFKALDKIGIEKLLKKYFSKIEFSEKQVNSIARYNSVTPGDFGSLSGRVRFIAPEKITADYITSELITLQKEKNETAANIIGFCA